MIDSYKIGHLMRQKGIGQGDLAALMNVDRKTVGTYLKTGQVKKRALLEPMARALGVEVDWLLPSNNSMSGNTQKGNQNAIGSTITNTNQMASNEETERLRIEVEVLRKEKEKLLNIIEKLSDRN